MQHAWLAHRKDDTGSKEISRQCSLCLGGMLDVSLLLLSLEDQAAFTCRQKDFWQWVWSVEEAGTRFSRGSIDSIPDKKNFTVRSLKVSFLLQPHSKRIKPSNVTSFATTGKQDCK